MCLTYPLPLSELYPEARLNFQRRLGWKVFSYAYAPNYLSLQLAFEFMTYRNSRRVPRDHWIEAEPIELAFHHQQNTPYQGGFHVYLVKPADVDAYPVRWRGALALGYQDHLQCVSAAKLYVPSDPRDLEQQIALAQGEQGAQCV